jgi:hypothetical protein
MATGTGVGAKVNIVVDLWSEARIALRNLPLADTERRFWDLVFEIAGETLAGNDHAPPLTPASP